MREPAVTLAIPCRTDEPSLRHTLEAAWAGCADAGVPDVTFVCLNGLAAQTCAASGDLRALASAEGRPVLEIDTDEHAGRPGPVIPAAGTIVVVRTRRVGKAIAWNMMRSRIGTDRVVFLDADVAVGGGAIGLLLAALAANPHAIIASPKTTCTPRPTWFEAIMAVPYRVDFPNLSGQLYAARVAGLPVHMPEDLIEPERWLELELGCEGIVREPAATVAVRLPATAGDFYRQRVRIEMGKVQLEGEYPHLLARGNPTPLLRAVLEQLSVVELGRLAVYMALRQSAHLVARRRYRRREIAGIWVQAASTKQWRT